MSQSPDNKSIASTLRWTRWNALLMFSIILCGLVAWHYGANSAYYSSIEIELFRNFLFIEIPGVLLILYAIVVVLTCRNQITTLPRCEYETVNTSCLRGEMYCAVNLKQYHQYSHGHII